MIRIAIKAAKTSKHKQHIGAIVSKGQRILSTACNAVRYKRGSFTKKWINSLHAEQAAILQIDDKQLKGASITVVRILKNGTLGNACPCPICRELIISKGLKEVRYSNENGDIVIWKVSNE